MIDDLKRVMEHLEGAEGLLRDKGLNFPLSLIRTAEDWVQAHLADYMEGHLPEEGE